MARTYNSGWRNWFNTASADINNNFVMEGLQEQIKQLDALLTSSPGMEKHIRNVISKVMLKALKRMRNEVHGDMPDDPRKAYKAVRMAVYRRILGGNINILNKKRAGSPSSYTPTRTLKSGQRGGNRRLRSDRTLRLDSYNAGDRGFILRFLNAGTNLRQIKNFHKDQHRSQVKRGTQGGDVAKYGKTTNTGSRGKIGQRSVFASHIIELGNFIDREIAREFNELMDGKQIY